MPHRVPSTLPQSVEQKPASMSWSLIAKSRQNPRPIGLKRIARWAIRVPLGSFSSCYQSRRGQRHGAPLAAAVGSQAGRGRWRAPTEAADTPVPAFVGLPRSLLGVWLGPRGAITPGPQDNRLGKSLEKPAPPVPALRQQQGATHAGPPEPCGTEHGQTKQPDPFLWRAKQVQQVA